MNNTQTTRYTTSEYTVPTPEPVYYTKGEIERETLAVYRRQRSYGWQPGAAEQEAAEFYAYQLTRLELRKLEAAREAAQVSEAVGADDLKAAAEPLHELAMAYRERAKAAEIEVVCAWCKRHLSGPVGAANVSHGICPVCAVNMEEVTA